MLRSDCPVSNESNSVAVECVKSVADAASAAATAISNIKKSDEENFTDSLLDHENNDFDSPQTTTSKSVTIKQKEYSACMALINMSDPEQSRRTSLPVVASPFGDIETPTLSSFDSTFSPSRLKHELDEPQQSGEGSQDFFDFFPQYINRLEPNDQLLAQPIPSLLSEPLLSVKQEALDVTETNIDENENFTLDHDYYKMASKDKLIQSEISYDELPQTGILFPKSEDFDNKEMYLSQSNGEATANNTTAATDDYNGQMNSQKSINMNEENGCETVASNSNGPMTVEQSFITTDLDRYKENLSNHINHQYETFVDENGHHSMDYQTGGQLVYSEYGNFAYYPQYGYGCASYDNGNFIPCYDTHASNFHSHHLQQHPKNIMLKMESPTNLTALDGDCLIMDQPLSMTTAARSTIGDGGGSYGNDSNNDNNEQPQAKDMMINHMYHQQQPNMIGNYLERSAAGGGMEVNVPSSSTEPEAISMMGSIENSISELNKHQNHRHHIRRLSSVASNNDNNGRYHMDCETSNNANDGTDHDMINPRDEHDKENISIAVMLTDDEMHNINSRYTHQRFPIKLWNLATDAEFKPIHWSSDGLSLIIDELVLEPCLGYFFRSKKFSSFLRQLHLYGFRKVTRARSHRTLVNGMRMSDEKVRCDFISEYQCQHFQRNRYDLVKLVRRFYGNASSAAAAAAAGGKSSSRSSTSPLDIQISPIIVSNTAGNAASAGMVGASMLMIEDGVIDYQPHQHQPPQQQQFQHYQFSSPSEASSSLTMYTTAPTSAGGESGDGDSALQMLNHMDLHIDIVQQQHDNQQHNKDHLPPPNDHRHFDDQNQQQHHHYHHQQQQQQQYQHQHQTYFEENGDQQQQQQQQVSLYNIQLVDSMIDYHQVDEPSGNDESTAEVSAIDNTTDNASTTIADHSTASTTESNYQETSLLEPQV